MTDGLGQPPSRSTQSAPKFELGRLSQTDRIVGIATLVLFISQFLDWFGIGSYSASGESAHGYLWIVAIICLVILAYYVTVALYSKLPFNVPFPIDKVLLVAVSINLILTLIAFLFKPAGAFSAYSVSVSWGWEFGAFIALIAAIIAAAPIVIPELRARRSTKSS